MVKDNPGTTKLVKFGSAMLAAFIALVIGFLGGIVFSAFKMEGTSGVVVSGESGTQDTVTAEEADRIEALEKAAAQDPNNPDGWIALGNAHYDSGLTEKSIQAYETALKLQPENADVWTDLGVMYRRNGEPEKAVSAFEKAQSVSPGHEVSLFNKGIVMMHDLNDMPGAMDAWKALLELNPAATTPSGMPIKELVDKMGAQM
jgi:cytochrome c-type biogenesis protein CcmH/NrfG